MPEQDVTHFSTVDHTSDPAFFLNFLDQANKIPGVIEWKTAILDGLRLEGGERVLDLGCGAGDDAFDIAARVGPRGRVTGVDISEFLIAEAIRRSSARNLSVSFEVGDGRSLRFADAVSSGMLSENEADLWWTHLAHAKPRARSCMDSPRLSFPASSPAVTQPSEWNTCCGEESKRRGQLLP